MSDTEESKKKIGRPSEYTQSIADRICELLADGISLRTVCKMDGMPAGATVFKWMRENDEFLKQYARAKQESADAMAEDILEIADTAEQIVRSGAEKKSGAYAQTQRLRVESRKWLMAKMKPKKYGDKVDVTSGGKPIPLLGGATRVEDNDSDEEAVETTQEA